MKSPMTLPLFWFHVHSSLSRSLLEVLLLFSRTSFGVVGWGGGGVPGPVPAPSSLWTSSSPPLSLPQSRYTAATFCRRPSSKDWSFLAAEAPQPLTPSGSRWKSSNTFSTFFFPFCARGCSKHQHKVRPHGSHQSSDKSCQPGPLRKKREAAVPELA